MIDGIRHSEWLSMQSRSHNLTRETASSEPVFPDMAGAARSFGHGQALQAGIRTVNLAKHNINSRLPFKSIGT
jgi:hypothetical protein